MVLEREAVVDLGRQMLEGGGSPIGSKPESRPADEVPKEIKIPLLEQTFRKHYERFLEEPVPALDGLTPRQAVRKPAMRPRLVELLKAHLRTMDEHSRREGHTFSIDCVLDELGITELKPSTFLIR